MSGNGATNNRQRIKERTGSYETEPRFEMIGGVRYDFLSSPKVVHQQIVGNLHASFHYSCRAEGIVLLAPLDVHFDDGDNIVQPDLIFIANENRAIVRDGFVFGTPDLLVEVLSDSTGRKDKSVKRAMYERFGVREYWIVEPNYRTVDQLVLHEGKYVLAATLTEEEIIRSDRYPCMSVDLKNVFPPEEE